MPSSRNTRSPSTESGTRLFVRITGEDNPKACTGRRLLRRGLAREWSGHSAYETGPILLDPRAPDPITVLDRPHAVAAGILVIDCSWNRLHSRRGFDPALPGVAGLERRRLPWLLAGNPQHYGRVGELNTAEAFAAALAVVGRAAEAARLLDGFAGGSNFLSINRERLARYAAARDGEHVRLAERELFSRESG